VAVAALGVILGAVYLLWMFQRTMFGPITKPENEKLADLSLRERLVFAPVIFLIFFMGIYPKPFLERIDPSAQAMVTSFQIKRCASILVADQDGPALMDQLVDQCTDPAAVIAEEYGPDDSGFGPVTASAPVAAADGGAK
jgi:NADH-quinone oxidoreductase subunit M